MRWTDGELQLSAGEVRVAWGYPFAVCYRCARPVRREAMTRLGELRAFSERRDIGDVWIDDPGDDLGAVVAELRGLGWRGTDEELAGSLRSTRPFKVDSFEAKLAADVAEDLEQLGASTRVEVTAIGEDDPNPPELRDAPLVERPSGESLERAIDDHAPSSASDLRQLRLQLLRTHNDAFRAQPVQTRGHLARHGAAHRNAEQLAKLLGDDPSDRLVHAEIERYFGDFAIARDMAEPFGGLHDDIGQLARTIAHHAAHGSRIVDIVDGGRRGHLM